MTIEYFVQRTTQNGATIDTDVRGRFILKSGQSFTKTVKKWKTHSSMKNDIYIRMIIESYFERAKLE